MANTASVWAEPKMMCYAQSQLHTSSIRMFPWFQQLEILEHMRAKLVSTQGSTSDL